MLISINIVKSPMSGRQPLVDLFTTQKIYEMKKKYLVSMFHVWVTLMNVEI